MQPISEQDLLASFVNVSVRERKAIPIPQDVDWDRRDFLGWRDPKLPLVGYVVIPIESEVIGVQLRETAQKALRRPQCAWCEDVTLPNEVVFFSAKRAGAAGRNHNTIGTLICAGFQCNANVRKPPPLAYNGFDLDAARLQRIKHLRETVTAFGRSITAGV